MSSPIYLPANFDSINNIGFFIFFSYNAAQDLSSLQRDLMF